MAADWRVKADRLARREGITFREACSRLAARSARVRQVRKRELERRRAEEERAAFFREMRPDLYD